MSIQVSKLTHRATIPQRGSGYAAGWDLYASEEIEVPANGKAIVKTDIAVAIPFGYYGRVAPRTGMAWTNHIDVGGGVVDSDYRGGIEVVLFNHGSKNLKIYHKDRVAQLIIEKINTSPLEEIPYSQLERIISNVALS